MIKAAPCLAIAAVSISPAVAQAMPRPSSRAAIRALVLCAAACLFAACEAENEEPATPADTLGSAEQSQLPPSDNRRALYEVGYGKGTPACEVFAQNMNARANKKPLTTMCDFPMADMDKRFSQPAWETIDPVAQIDIVESIFVRGDWSRAWIGYLDVTHGNDPDREKVLEDEYWQPLKPQVMQALDSGDAKLQRASFDADNDGSLDVVYRMTFWELQPTLREDKTTPLAQRKVVFGSPWCTPGTWFRYLGAAELSTRNEFGFGLNRYVSFPHNFVQFEGRTFFGDLTTFMKTAARSGGDIHDLVLENEDGSSTGSRCSMAEQILP